MNTLRHLFCAITATKTRIAITIVLTITMTYDWFAIPRLILSIAISIGLPILLLLLPILLIGLPIFLLVYFLVTRLRGAAQQHQGADQPVDYGQQAPLNNQQQAAWDDTANRIDDAHADGLPYDEYLPPVPHERY